MLVKIKSVMQSQSRSTFVEKIGCVQYAKAVDEIFLKLVNLKNPVIISIHESLRDA